MGNSRFSVCFLLVGLFLCGLALLTPREASAQSDYPPVVSLVMPQGAEALWGNPASLPWAADWALFGGAETPTDGWTPSVYGAATTSLPFGLGVGVGGSRSETADGVNTAVYSALGFAPSRQLAVGIAGMLRRGTTEDRMRFDYDVHLIWRQSRRWHYSLNARGLWSAWRGASESRPSEAHFNVLLRPYESEALQAEAGVFSDPDGHWGLRAMLGLAVPRLGTLRLGWQTRSEDSRIRHEASLELRVAYDQGAIATGVSTRSHGGSASRAFGALAYQGTTQAGIPPRAFVRELRLRGELNARNMILWARRLDQCLHDTRVEGVVLRLQGAQIPIAYAQELRLQIASLENAGKTVACVMSDPSGPEAYVCASASRRILDPAGMVRWTGVSRRSVHLADAMSRLGVRADFLRIGQYKDAPEPLTNPQRTAPSRAQQRQLTNEVGERMAFDISRDLSVSQEIAQRLVTEGPHVASSAMERGIVTHLHDTSQLSRAYDVRGQGSLALVSDPTPRSQHVEATSAPIGVVVVDDNIVNGRNVDIPLIDVHASGGDTIVRAIDRLAADPAVKVIILRVDSPGGAAFASDQIWRAVRRATREKPVLASLGRVAASGGYYVASAADEIWANPSTVTGSIGILMGKVDIAPLAARLGISSELDATSDRAGALSMWSPFSSAQRAILADLIREGYRRFLDRVAEGRNQSSAWVHERGQGRIWSGDAALREGLVDRLGGFGSVLARARQLADLAPESRITVHPQRPRTLVDYVLSGSGSNTGIAAPVRQQLNRWWSALHGDQSTPLALMPNSMNW